MRRRYRFRHAWDAPAAPSDVYAVLYELVQYPAWWPYVKEAKKLDEDNVALTAHAVLPYTLNMVMRRVRADPEAGILETRIRGDLRGWARWTIRPIPTGTHVSFEEEVVLNKQLLGLLEAIVWPVYCVNHDLTVRGAERLFSTFLAGYLLGKQTGTTGQPASERPYA